MKFKYTCKTSSGVSLPGGREVIFHEDQVYDLPEDNAYIKTLVSCGYLEKGEQEPENHFAGVSKMVNVEEVENAG